MVEGDGKGKLRFPGAGLFVGVKPWIRNLPWAAKKLAVRKDWKNKEHILYILVIVEQKKLLKGMTVIAGIAFINRNEITAGILILTVNAKKTFYCF